MRRLAVLLALAPAIGLADAGAQSPAAIDSIVERAIRTFGNQGAAVAVVKDGKVIARGYGIDQVTMRAKDPETDFSFDFHNLLLKPKRAR